MWSSGDEADSDDNGKVCLVAKNVSFVEEKRNVSKEKSYFFMVNKIVRISIIEQAKLILQHNNVCIDNCQPFLAYIDLICIDALSPYKIVVKQKNVCAPKL